MVKEHCTRQRNLRGRTEGTMSRRIYGGKALYQYYLRVFLVGPIKTLFLLGVLLNNEEDGHCLKKPERLNNRFRLNVDHRDNRRY